MAEHDNGGSFVIGFLVGGIVGAAIGLMLAPKSGADTRQLITQRSEAWRSRAEEMAANLSGQIGPAIETARERVNPTIENVRSRVEPAVESVREKVNPVVEQVSARIPRRQSPDEAVSTNETGETVDAGEESSEKQG